MDAEWVTHVVRMVVEHDDLHGCVGRRIAPNQQMTDVMIVTTAKKNCRFWFYWRRFCLLICAQQRGRFKTNLAIQTFQRAERTAEAYGFLPMTQGQAGSSWQWQNRAVKIENQNVCGRHCASASKNRLKGLMTKRSNGFLTYTACWVNVKCAPRLRLISGSVQPAT